MFHGLMWSLSHSISGSSDLPHILELPDPLSCYSHPTAAIVNRGWVSRVLATLAWPTVLFQTGASQGFSLKEDFSLVKGDR